MIDEDLTDAEAEAEIRAEFQMNWVCSGGHPDDGSTAFAERQR